MSMRFDPVDPKTPLPKMERGILQYWKEEDTFKRSVHMRKQEHGDKNAYSFYDGPPFATGLPHYGHLLAGTIKDVIPRYQTMKGKCVQRRFGWDCHGLPIENLIEKEYDIKDHKEIEAMGIDTFSDLCRSAVQRYTDEWRQIVERMGRWVDMDWDYRTMDPEYMESMWWAFKQLHDKSLIYEGHKPMHVCPRCVTPLSNFEVTQGYEDITDQSVTAKFKLKDEPNTYVLAWTTTPWTLPGNLLLAVGKNLEYVKFKDESKDDKAVFIASKAFFEAHAKKSEAAEILEEFKGKDLLGKPYEPLFPYFADDYAQSAFRVVEGDFVTTEDGTGVVHIAPGFGEDDFEVGKREGLEVLQHVTMDGKFTEDVTDFAGMDVKPSDDPSKTDKKIAAFLEERGSLFASESYRHSYPHCWRCDSPLLNYATSSWFVDIQSIKDAMLRNKDRTEWVPAHLRDGRFGNWLEGARDWAISRNRYWGTPLPIWRCDESDVVDVIGGRSDLMSRNKIRFTKVTAVRHGESEGNLIPIYQGKVPGTDLTEAGKAQARATGKKLKTDRVDIIYCSPLARTKQTAEIIAEETGAQLIVDERLQEVQFGDYEGKTVDFSDLSFVKAKRAHKLEQDSPESIYHFPGMETWQSVYDRISSFFADVLPRHRSEHVVVVTHADPVQSIKHHFTKEDPLKISHQPYPQYAQPHTFYWDHSCGEQMDLHKDRMDPLTWQGPHCDAGIDLTLVRHGRTEWNEAGKIQGWENSPLTADGERGAREAAKKLKNESFDLIVTSDLGRCVQTANILAEELSIGDIEQSEAFRERNVGDWSGRHKEELRDTEGFDPSIDDSLQAITPANGESFDEFEARVRSGLEQLLERHAGKKILLVLHGGSMQMARMLIENMTIREAHDTFPKNAEPYRATLNPFMRRIPEVLDCWFESGSMPYAQSNFPFSTENDTPQGFPADFIAEGVDQCRAWFYTLMVLSTAIFDDTPYKHVVVNGIVLAEDGKKMSKRLKNYPDPMEIVEKYGADAIRFTLMSSPAVRGEDLRMSERLVEESMRSVLLPLWNTYSFFVTYANAADFEPVETRTHSTHPLDMWIRAEIQDLTNRMTQQLDDYDLSATCAELYETIDALTNWYVRLSRRRFAGKGNEGAHASDTAKVDVHEDRSDALHTLHDVLITLSQLLAPFCPFITEAMYLNLVPEDHGSIHFTDWPETRTLDGNECDLLRKTRLQRLITRLGLSIRGEKNIKNRQPLRSATVAAPDHMLEGIEFTSEDLHVLKQELNVKELHMAEDAGSLAEAYVRVDARKVGPKLGKRVQEIIKAGKEGDFSVDDDGRVRIKDVTLEPEEAEVAYGSKEGSDVAADRGVVVSIDVTLTDDLVIEGHARDLIRSIQRLRKESGLEFTDLIHLSVEGADPILEAHKDMISHETNSVVRENNGSQHTIELNDNKVTVRFAKQ